MQPPVLGVGAVGQDVVSREWDPVKIALHFADDEAVAVAEVPGSELDEGGNEVLLRH